MTTKTATSTTSTATMCEATVDSGKRSYWSGDPIYRECRNPRRFRFYGRVGGACRTEELCRRHADVYLAPIAMPGWIKGTVELNDPACRKGHDFKATPTRDAKGHDEVISLCRCGERGDIDTLTGEAKS
jgi:hypothetical protein